MLAGGHGLGHPDGHVGVHRVLAAVVLALVAQLLELLLDDLFQVPALGSQPMATFHRKVPTYSIISLVAPTNSTSFSSSEGISLNCSMA